MITVGNYFVEILSVLIILYCPIRNTALKNVIGNLDDGIITISFGIVSGQTYLGVTDILARFVRRSFFSNIEESLLDQLI
ncbi:MAG: hypothetical protein WBM37_15025 [Nitrososphaeraceae archaeon]|jgi:hypothetical protein